LKFDDKATLRARFRDAAARYGKAIKSGDSRAARRLLAKGVQTRDKLIEGESESIDFLAELLSDAEPWVDMQLRKA
jgi:hypothetical protein